MADWAQGREEAVKWARRVLAWPWLDVLLDACAVLDSFAVGLEIDYPGLLTPLAWMALGAGLNLLFTWELALRLAAGGPSGLRRQPLHAFLGLVTLLGWLEVLAKLVVMVFLPLPRGFVQVLRALRSLRLGNRSPDFHVVLQSVALSARELPCFLGALALLFVIAACAATAHIGHAKPRGEAAAQAARDFASLDSSLFTLLQLMLLEGWPEVVRPLMEEHWLWAPPLLTFIVVANVFFLSAITGVVVERTLEARQQEGAHQQAKRTAKDQKLVAQLHAELLRLNGGEQTMAKGRLMQCIGSHEGQVPEFMASLKFGRNEMIAAFEVCDLKRKGQASLSSLRRVWEDSKRPLTMMKCIHLRQHLVGRLERLEHLNSLVLARLALLAAQC